MKPIKFIRNTLPREGEELFKKGDVVDVSEASATHWISRRAAVAHSGTKPEKKTTPAANKTPKKGN